jgi:hypothetical protein
MGNGSALQALLMPGGCSSTVLIAFSFFCFSAVSSSGVLPVLGLVDKTCMDA